jgi:hypothetical protein
MPATEFPKVGDQELSQNVLESFINIAFQDGSAGASIQIKFTHDSLQMKMKIH